MCGINGFNFKNEQLIQAMNQAIQHRGPDDQGVYADDNFTFGHLRLSIIDLSAAGHQPMFSADGNLVIIYNGELYNFLEIKKDLLLKGYNFRSKSDTEVILCAYQEYGENCLQKFNGIFSFAIWNKKTKELFAARDHLGIKPFFYYYHQNKFIFSSEIKGILAHPIDRSMNFDALNLYFRFLYIPGLQTPFQYIKKLPPASYLRFKDNKLEIKKYWQAEVKPEIFSFVEAKEQLRKTFDQSVKRQLISDRPLGLFLSGGIDSTAVLGAMSQAAAGRIKTFSVGFDVDVQQDKFNLDSILAKKTSQHYHTEHHELILKPRDILDNLEMVVYHMDDLVSNHIQTAMYLLSKMTKQTVDVVLSGDGGDEIFGGYDRYYYYNIIEKWQKFPKILRKNFISQGLFQILGKQDWYQKLNADDVLGVYWQFRAQPKEELARFLKPEFNRQISAERIVNDSFFTGDHKNLTDYLMQVDRDNWLIDEALAKADRMTMAHALEQRVPILDRELVELAAKIPNKFKIHSSSQGKYVFKEAVKNYLPEYIYHKPKTGWFSPASKWLRTDLKDMAYQVLSPDYNQDTDKFFDFKEIRKILDSHISQEYYALNTVWSLIIFQIWYKMQKQ